jgi:hypothetical protein
MCALGWQIICRYDKNVTKIKILKSSKPVNYNKITLI